MFRSKKSSLALIAALASLASASAFSQGVPIPVPFPSEGDASMRAPIAPVAPIISTTPLTLSGYLASQRSAIEMEIWKANAVVEAGKGKPANQAAPKPVVKPVVAQAVVKPSIPTIVGFMDNGTNSSTIETSFNGATNYSKMGERIGDSDWKLAKITRNKSETILMIANGKEQQNFVFENSSIPNSATARR